MYLSSRNVLIASVFLAFAASGLTVRAQSPGKNHCAAPQYREFDFWAGDWNVTDTHTKKPVGTNTVTHELGGCVLQEHWKGSDGSVGTSFNLYETSTRRWHQSWVDNAGGLLLLDGGLHGKEMILSGTTTGKQGKSVMQRITWTQLPDGTVRQHWIASSDHGKTWKDAFDGIYKKKQG